MKHATKLFAIAVLSIMLVTGLAGCINVTVTAPASSSSASGSDSSAAASSSASASTSTSASASASKSTSASASTSSTSNSGDSGRGNAEPAGSQRYGKPSTGYVSVPSDWKDYTSKLDPRAVEASDATYLVDPTTEFTSAVEAHFAFSSSIKLETFPCKYTDKADELLYDYRGRTDDYTTPSIEKTTFNGHNASIVACSSADNVDITNIAIEKDANTCVLITAWGTRSTDEAVLSYVATWSLTK